MEAKIVRRLEQARLGLDEPSLEVPVDGARGLRRLPALLDGPRAHLVRGRGRGRS